MILTILTMNQNLFAESVEKAFSISPSSNYGFSEYDSGDKGVIKKNGIVTGVYLNPIYTLSSKHLATKRYILFKGVMDATDILRDEANSNFKIILATRKEVMDTITTLDIVKKITERVPYTTADQFTKNYFDTMIDIYSSECNKASNKDDLSCKIVKSPLFGWIKDIGFATWDKYFEEYATTELKKLALDGAVETVATVMFAADTTLKVSKIVTDFTSAYAINNSVIKKLEISLMLMDFNSAYQYFNMDIDKLSKFLVKKSKEYHYNFNSLSPDINHLNTFVDVFFHYIHLRKVTEFGKYNFELKKVMNNYGNSVETVDMSVAPQAAQLMLTLIEKYGNGGNFKINITPNQKYGIAYLTWFEKSYNFLYSMPTDADDSVHIGNKGTTSQGKDIHFYKAYLNPKVHYDANVKIKCKKLLLPYRNSNGISSNGYMPIVSSLASKYEVQYNNGAIDKLYLHKFNVKIECKYTAEQLGLDYTWTKSKKLENFYIPEKLSDIRGKFAESHIRNMYNLRYIIGYNDGLFHGDWSVRNGEFLKIASRAILKFTDKTTDSEGQFFTDIGGKFFSKYIKYLNSKNINIDLLDGTDINDRLDNYATRGYVAKVIANILKKDDEQFSKCDKTNVEDWDKCSEYLKGMCILKGSEKDENSKVFIYKPNIEIRRDEISKIISNAMAVYKDGSLCDNKKDLK